MWQAERVSSSHRLLTLSAETRPASPAAPCAHQWLHASGGEGDAHHTHGRRVG